jgi:hypothetical protein
MPIVRKPPRGIDVLVRILFALLAMGTLVALLSGLPRVIPELDPSPSRLLLVAILVTSLGMAIPWGRWVPLQLPGRDLGFISKLLGWASACGVPLAVASHDWVATTVCMLLPLLAFALWKRCRWAAWPWYGVAMVCLAPSALGVIVLYYLVMFRVQVSGSGLSQGVWIGITIIWTLFWSSIAVALMRELTVWRRDSRSPSQACSSQSAG